MGLNESWYRKYKWTQDNQPGKKSYKYSVGNCTKFDFKGLCNRELSFPVHTNFKI